MACYMRLTTRTLSKFGYALALQFRTQRHSRLFHSLRLNQSLITSDQRFFTLDKTLSSNRTESNAIQSSFGLSLQKLRNGLQFKEVCLSRSFSTMSALHKAKTVKITFIDRDGDKKTVDANVGDTLLDVAKDHDIDVEGACEGTLACSTCHLIFEENQYEKLDLDPPTEEELDMLDLAYGLTDTSRLGCQIEVTEDLDGVVLTVPKVTVDIRASS